MTGIDPYQPFGFEHESPIQEGETDMSDLRAIFVFLLLFVASISFADEPPHELPPKFTVVPVEQDASWAVEWWRNRHDEKIEQAKVAEVDLVFIGDSITHGWEDAGAEVWQEYYQERNAFNLGFGGDRTEHVLWRLENGAVSGMTPKLAVVMIGTNNTGHRMDPAEYTAEGIERIVSDLRKRLPETRVLVLGIFPRHVSPYNEMRKRNDEINKLVSRLHNGDSVYFLDIGQVFLRDDGTLREDLMPDLLHFNAAGYKLWAKSMEPTVERLLRD